jgi:predicted deacylase
VKTFTITEHTLPKASPGTERKIQSLHFGPEGRSRKLYIQAGLHADEAPGYLVAARLVELMKAADSEGKILEEIVVVPVANPIGLSQWESDSVRGRFDRNDNVNFNRNYDSLAEDIAQRIEGKLTDDSAENVSLIRTCCGEILRERQPSTESEFLKNLLQQLAHDADIVLDLHCDHQALVHIYVGTPLWPDCSDLAAFVGSGATLLADDSGGTPYDEANSKIWWELAARFPEYPIPPACLAATVELRGILDTDPEQTEMDAQNLMKFIIGRGYVAGDVVEPPALVAEATPLEGVDYVVAEDVGILSYLVQPGAFVKEGQTIAEVLDPLEVAGGEKNKRFRKSIKTRTSGVLFARGADRFARPGKIVAKVAGTKSLAEKGSSLLTS